MIRVLASVLLFALCSAVMYVGMLGFSDSVALVKWGSYFLFSGAGLAALTVCPALMNEEKAKEKHRIYTGALAGITLIVALTLLYMAKVTTH